MYLNTFRFHYKQLNLIISLVIQLIAWWEGEFLCTESVC